MYFRDIGSAARIVDDSRSAQLSAAWSAGVAASVFVGGHFFTKAAGVPGRQSRLMAGLLAVSTVSLACLALLPPSVETETGLWVRVALVFVSLHAGMAFHACVCACAMFVCN
jgi:alpha-D-ribose 1-methylphosphonate 5-triphosphate synthase subunit PhnH